MSHFGYAKDAYPPMKPGLARLALCLVCAPAFAAESAALASARALFEAGRFSEAQPAFEALAAAEPDSADPHYYLGEIALGRDDADTAVRELERATALSPGSARAHDALGDAFGRSAQKAGMLSKFGLARRSLAEFRRAVALEPANADFHESLFGYFANAPAIVGGGADKAADEAAVLARLDPRRGHQAFATLYATQGKYDLALTELDALLKAAPDDYAALYQVGRNAALAGQHLDRGLASLRRCLALPVPEGAPPHAAAQWRIGTILELQGDREGARAAYLAALKIDPAFAQASDSLRGLR